MKRELNIEKLDFEKSGGLIPAVIVDYLSLQLLMTGFMNREALEKTIETGKVTFFSRTKRRLWTKGETSGNFLSVRSITPDCDNDTLLVKVTPAGPVCHTGSYTCFGDGEERPLNFLSYLYDLIDSRKKEMPEGSYTSKLFNRGSDRIIQKVGEEAIEVVIAAKNMDREEIINESADLLFHWLVMLNEQGIDPAEVIGTLVSRHK